MATHTTGEQRIAQLRQQIDRMMVRQPFTVVEDLINTADGLTNDERGWLWLYAWSSQRAARQRRELDRHLVLMLSHPSGD